MIALSRSGIRDAGKAGLPALIHFGNRTPWHVPVGAQLRAIRLHLPETGILDLSALRLDRLAPGALPPHRAEMSSSMTPDAKPERLLRGQAIHTQRQDLPWWRLVFEQPQHIESLTIVNRGDMFASRGYGLCVDCERADGAWLGVDNLSAPTVRGRLHAFATRLDAAARGAIHPPAIEPLRRHLARMAAAIDAADTGPGDLARAREATLVEVGRILERADGAALRALCGIADLLDGMIWRGADAPVLPSPSEMPVAAFCLAATISEHGICDLNRLVELQRLLPTAESLIAMESAVDGFVRRLEEHEPPIPVRILPHGMRRSDWAAAEHAYVASVREVIALLAGYGHAGGLGYGTLLGAVRDGRLIAHDDDVDILAEMRSRNAAELDVELAALVARLQAEGIQAWGTPGFQFLKVTAPCAGRVVDVFPVLAPDPETVRLYLRQMEFADLRRDSMLPFGTLPFYGAPISVPRDPAHFLERHFGRTWRIPNRFSRFYWISPPTVTS